MLKEAEEGKGKSKSSGTSNITEFKISDLQKCGKYVTFLTLVYFIMTLSQICNLLFMTFAGLLSILLSYSQSTFCFISFVQQIPSYHLNRKPKVEDVCAKKYPDYISTKACNVTNCWVTTNQSGKVVCTTKTYDFIPISYDFDIPIEYIKLGTTVQNIGLMIGAIVAGNLADVFGRKKILLSFTAGLIIFLVATSFSPSFVVFTILRFFDMLFTGGKHCVCNPYFMENLPDRHRMWVATVVTYSPNYITLAGIAYICKKWKVLFLMDTPRWLIKKGKGEEASKAAIYIQKWDVKLTPEKEKQIDTVVREAAKEELIKMGKGKKNYYFYHLFSDWKLSSYAIVFATSLFSTSFISYGIAYNMDALAGTVYVNVIILGATRWAINISAAALEFSIQKVGRRLLHLVAVGFIAVIMAIIFVIYIFTCEKSIQTIIAFTRYASLLAAAMCTELFVLDSVQPTELFPTPIRSAGIAFIQTFNRLGTIVSPLVFIPSKHWPPAPFLLMLITSSADFLLYFFLVPETRGKKLPDNMPGEEPQNVVEKSPTTGNEKMKGDNIGLIPKSRQDKNSASGNIAANQVKGQERKIEERNKVDDKKKDEKESNKEKRISEEKEEKKGSEEDEKKTKEKKEERQQKSNEGSRKEQSSETEKSGKEQRRETGESRKKQRSGTERSRKEKGSERGWSRKERKGETEGSKKERSSETEKSGKERSSETEGSRKERSSETESRESEERK
uniref:MFS domain-containing protein n=1 Tax=Onchocerca volvulus TaxID=6282 RepID=A0A8R1XQF1_ONCVO